MLTSSILLLYVIIYAEKRLPGLYAVKVVGRLPEGIES